MTSPPLLALLHLCDSLFPTGGFGHSDGLESATDAGLVATAADLGDWMDACLDQSIAQCDGPSVGLAWDAFVARDWAALAAINAEAHALRASAASRQASRAMGARLVRTWHELYAPPALAELFRHLDVDGAMTFPAAFGVVTASAQVDRPTAIAAFVYTRLAATTSAAMRLMPIGQHEAHRVLAARLRRAGTVADAIAARTNGPGMFAPALDIASMSQQYVHSRLFRS